MKLKILILFHLIVIKSQLFSQTDNNNARPRIDNVIVPSPNAASLGKFGEIPVSLYTGIPSISIPLFSLTEGDIRLPISLSYHAGGVKVEEEASWVGLGWSLNAGGVITRSIANFDDLSPYGYPFTNQVTPATINSTSNSCFYSNGQPCFEPDVEPDIFFFNFLGYSGKFVLPKDSDKQFPVTAKVLSKDKIEIVCESKLGVYPDIYKWIIKTPDGTKYIFNTAEATLLRNTNSDAFYPNSAHGSGFRDAIPSPFFVKDVDDSNRDKETITSWYLTEIISPQKRKVIFEYVTAEYYSVKSIPSTSETRRLTMAYNQGAGFGCTRQEYLSSFVFNQTVTKNVYLSKIYLTNGNVEFRHSDREDMQKDKNNPEITSPKKIEEIILNADGSSRGFRFAYGYFNPLQAFKGKRLRLESLTEFDAIASKFKSPYKFYYNGYDPNTNLYPDNLLPPKDSKSKDHWGYYNGADNDNIYDEGSGTYKATLIPNNIRIPIPGLSIPYIYIGANRETNPEFSKKGVLEKVVYPTGASSSFEYEANAIKKSDYDYIFPFATTGIQLIKINESRPSAAFELKETTQIKITREVSCNCPTAENCLYAQDNKMWAEFQLGTAPSIRQYTFEEYNTRGECSIYRTETITLSAGCYYARVIPFGNYHVEMKFETVNGNSVIYPPCVSINTPQVNIPVGGLRVKRSYDYENSKIVNDKYYDYSQVGIPSNSSGYLMSQPKYTYYNSYFTSIDQLLVPCNAEYGCVEKFSSYAVLNSFPNSPISTSAQGNHIGYSYVTVRYGINGVNGYSVHNFLNMVDQVNPLSIISTTPGIIHLGNGLPISETYYKSTGDKIKELNYELEQKNTDYITGVKAAVIGMINLNDCGSPLGTLYPKIAQDYQIISEWWVTKKVTERTYNEIDPLKYVEKVTKNFYENLVHFQLTKQTTTTSGSNKVKVINYQYPADFTTNSNPVIDEMKGARHIHNNIIQATVLEEKDAVQKALSSTIYKYGLRNNLDGSSSIVLNEVAALETNKALTLSSPAEFSYYDPSVASYPSGFKIKNTNHVFDDKSNLLQKVGSDGIVASYLYGYKSTYPVAQILNASSDEIFHANFEENGGWDGAMTAYDKTFSHTGKGSGRIDKATSGEQVSMSNTWLNITLSAPKKYKYSGWIYSNGPTADIFLFMKRAGEAGYFSYVAAVTVTTTNKWTYVEGEYDVPADVTQLNIRVDNNGGGTVWFDDLRLHPSAAQMTTYTYAPLIGMTSLTDATNRTAYYEYDGFNRLMHVRDQDGNILKKYCYNYAGQTIDCKPTNLPGIYIRISYENTYQVSGVTYGNIVARFYSDEACTLPLNVSNLSFKYNHFYPCFESGNSSDTPIQVTANGTSVTLATNKYLMYTDTREIDGVSMPYDCYTSYYILNADTYNIVK